MKKTMTYTPSHKMSELATVHFRILLVLSRFGIGLGFGEKTIAEVCKENNVDVATFLAVANMLVKDNEIPEEIIPNISPETLITYLQRSHEYFLEFRLPGIRQGLENVLTERKNDLNNAVLNYFDEYVEEVRKHMMYEETKVFPYIRELLEGKNNRKYNIDIFRRHHDQVEYRLKEFNPHCRYYGVKYL